nr:ATP-dependent DNA helicase PIF1-like [Coffea arabica]
MGKSLGDFHLTDIFLQTFTHEWETMEIEAERNIIVSKEDLSTIDQLNQEQKIAYHKILSSVYDTTSTAFFVDGPGGTGKTFLYRALLAKIRSQKHIALATVTSGVTTSILPGGKTAHSHFKIPLNDDEGKTCNISKQSSIAQLIKDAKLIIWDEATMAERKAIERFDQLLQDIMSNKEVFGGKTVIFGGDFRQTLSVIVKGKKNDMIDVSLVKSHIWNHLEKIHLTENMRARLDPDFSSYLLRVGNGTEITTNQDEIKIPPGINVPFIDDASSITTLTDMVFEDLYNMAADNTLPINKAILMTRNDFVHEINDILIDKFPGDEKCYLSFDQPLESSGQIQNEDFLHTLMPKGLPPHQLKLKKNCLVMLLRNINPTEGLSNGTRLICREFGNNVQAEITFGSFAKKIVFIPLIPLESPTDDFSSIPFKRTQFPLRLYFAMTINKAQGQTLDYVGLYLKEHVFSHGQLYVALSRAKTATNVKVLI